MQSVVCVLGILSDVRVRGPGFSGHVRLAGSSAAAAGPRRPARPPSLPVTVAGGSTAQAGRAVLPVDLFNFSESSSVFLPGRRPRLSLAFTGRLQQPFEFESSQPLTRNTDTAWVSDHNWLGPARRGSGQPESLTR